MAWACLTKTGNSPRQRPLKTLYIDLLSKGHKVCSQFIVIRVQLNQHECLEYTVQQDNRCQVIIFSGPTIDPCEVWKAGCSRCFHPRSKVFCMISYYSGRCTWQPCIVCCVLNIYCSLLMFVVFYCTFDGFKFSIRSIPFCHDLFRAEKREVTEFTKAAESNLRRQKTFWRGWGRQWVNHLWCFSIVFCLDLWDSAHCGSQWYLIDLFNQLQVSLDLSIDTKVLWTTVEFRCGHSRVNYIFDSLSEPVIVSSSLDREKDPKELSRHSSIEP